MAAFGALALVAFGLMLWLTRDLTFTQDEWDFIQWRRGGGDDAFLRPHNDHLLVVLVLIYKGLWSTVGLAHYWPTVALATALHLVCVALVFVLVRQRVGATLALAACLPLLVFGAASEALTMPFNMQWYLSLGALLAIVLLWEREGLVWDVLIGALLGLALTSSSFGPAAALGLAAACLVDRRWRRLAIAAVPVALYGAWFLAYAVDAPNQPENELTFAPRYLVNMALGSVAALGGAPLGVEEIRVRDWLSVPIRLGALAVFAGLAYQFWFRRRLVTPTLALIATSLAAYWVVISITRGHTGFPYTSRYMYIGPILLVLLAAELFRGTVLPRRWAAVALGLALISAAANTVLLANRADERVRKATILRAELGTLETLRGEVPANFQPDRIPDGAITILAGPYFEATDDIGSSPAATPEEIRRMPDYAKRAAFEVALRASAARAGD